VKLKTKVLLAVFLLCYIGAIIAIRAFVPIRPIVVSVFRWYFISLMLVFFVGNIVSIFRSNFFDKLGNGLAAVFMYGVYLTLALLPLYLAARTK